MTKIVTVSTSVLVKSVLTIFVLAIALLAQAKSQYDGFKTAHLQQLYKNAEAAIYNDNAMQLSQMLMREGKKQNDTLAITEAYTQQVYIYALKDKNPNKAREILYELKQHYPKRMNAIFNCFRFVMYGYQNNGLFHTAMVIAREMTNISQEPRCVIEGKSAIYEHYNDTNNEQMALNTMQELCQYIDRTFPGEKIKKAYMAATIFSEMALAACSNGKNALALKYLKRTKELYDKYKDDYEKRDHPSQHCLWAFQLNRYWYIYGTYCLQHDTKNSKPKGDNIELSTVLKTLLADKSDDSKRYYYNLVMEHAMNQGKWHQALQASDSIVSIKKRMEINPYTSLYFKNRAEILEHLRDYKGVVECYKKLVEINDSNRLAEARSSTEEFSQLLGLHDLQRRNSAIQEELEHKKLQEAYFFIFVSVVILIVLGLWLFSVLRARKKLQRAYNDVSCALEMKTNFIRNIQHEIRTPLNAIVGFSQIVDMNYADNPECKEMTKLIVDNGVLLTKLIDNIIDVSDVESRQLKVSTFNPVALLHDTVRQMEHHTECSFEITTQMEPNSDQTFCSDMDLIGKALALVIDNATKFAKEGHVVLNCAIDGDLLRYTVTDNGPGIPADKQEWVFEQFTKINPFTVGTGIGLPLCRAIARRLGGNAKIDACYTQGCRIIIEVKRMKG